MKTDNIHANKGKFEKLLSKRKALANAKKNNICKVSATDSQLNDVLMNFKEESLYYAKIRL